MADLSDEIEDLLTDEPLTATSIAQGLLVSKYMAERALDRLMRRQRIETVAPEPPLHPVVRYALARQTVESRRHRLGRWRPYAAVGPR